MIMNRIQLQCGLDALDRDLERIESMSEEEVCKTYNADCKSDIIEVIEEEIATYKRLLEPIEEDKMDYASLQSVQGMPVTQW